MLSLPFRRPRLSIVVVFFNMTREAPRTLYSMSTAYQRGVAADDYEVIAIDSGSSQRIDPALLDGLQGHFRYAFVQPTDPTPCEALNAGIAMARGRYVACAIDGARILSPGVLAHSFRALDAIPDALVCTMGMHLGPMRQTLSVSEGYCQSVEDALLDDCGWTRDGYRLFDVSVPAGSSQGGFLRPIKESNFFSVRKKTLLDVGGFDESFRSPGGGLVNLDLYNRLLQRPDVQPVMLLGEATFHQFHGGVSTNVPAAQHPLEEYKREYRRIRGTEFRSVVREPLYFGHVPQACRKFLDCSGH